MSKKLRTSGLFMGDPVDDYVVDFTDDELRAAWSSTPGMTEFLALRMAVPISTFLTDTDSVREYACRLGPIATWPVVRERVLAEIEAQRVAEEEAYTAAIAHAESCADQVIAAAQAIQAAEIQYYNASHTLARALERIENTHNLPMVVGSMLVRHATREERDRNGPQRAYVVEPVHVATVKIRTIADVNRDQGRDMEAAIGPAPEPGDPHPTPRDRPGYAF